MSGLAKPHVLHTCELKKGDGVYLELGWLEPSEEKYVVVPYMHAAGIEHKYSISLYTDYEHIFEKINPRLQCPECLNGNGLTRVMDELDRMQKVAATVLRKEQELHFSGEHGPQQGGGGRGRGASGYSVMPTMRPPPRPPVFIAGSAYAVAPADSRGSGGSVAEDEGVVSVAELFDYKREVGQREREAHSQYEQHMKKVQGRTAALTKELEEVSSAHWTPLDSTLPQCRPKFCLLVSHRASPLHAPTPHFSCGASPRQVLKEEMELEEELRKEYLCHVDDSKSRTCLLQ